MSYLPPTKTPSPWTSEIQFPKGHQRTPLGPVSSGSSRNMKRGYTGDPEFAHLHATIGGAVNAAVHGIARYAVTKAALSHTEADLDDIASAGHTPSLGSPTPFGPNHDANGVRTRHADGSPLGLPAGARAHPERIERLALPAAGQTSAPRQFPSQLALPRPGQTENAKTSLPQARPHPFTGPLVESQFAGFGERLESSTPPDARSAVGPSMGSSIPANPATKIKGRRAPAGMDPRKRGTFANFS
jgi:hypothetical protein